jgi:hypothetical protein
MTQTRLKIGPLEIFYTIFWQRIEKSRQLGANLGFWQCGTCGIRFDNKDEWGTGPCAKKCRLTKKCIK